MSPARLLGVVACTAGSTLLLGEWLVGQELLSELIGNNWASLRLVSCVAIVLGAIGIGLGIQEEREKHSRKGATEP